MATDSAGNVFVAGGLSHNVLRITPGGLIREIIDAAGDGTGNTLDFPAGIAVDGTGTAYVAGRSSDNVFKIDSISSPSGAFLDDSGSLLE